MRSNPLHPSTNTWKDSCTHLKLAQIYHAKDFQSTEHAPKHDSWIFTQHYTGKYLNIGQSTPGIAENMKLAKFGA